VKAISIALVDDHRVVARSLQAYLESFSDLRIAGIAARFATIGSGARRWKW